MIAYRATLDVPGELAQFVARLLAAERRRRPTPRGSRALTCFGQAVLGVRWFRDRATPGTLARDHGICRATAYRYLDEVIAVLAEQAPDLAEALERAKDEGFWHVILDGKVIPADRCKEPTVSVKARSSTCGTPGRRTPTAATSGPCSPPAASAMGLRRGAGAGARSHRRPHPRPARPLPRRR